MMETSSEIRQNDDKVSEDDAVIVQNGIDTSDSEDDDEFFSQLFTGGASPKFVPTDIVPWLDDSDSDAGASEILVKFYVDKSNSVALAQYDGTEYRVGFLDLTQEEYSCLSVVSETTVELSVNEKCISLHENKFYIKRINDRQEDELDSEDIVESLFEKLKLKCINFSTTEPLLAKYENDVYLVGDKLSKEYLNLLNRTKTKAGTAIRIHRNRLKVDKLNQMLDVNDINTFRNQNELCIISGLNDLYQNQDGARNEISRFVICHNPCILLKVEPQLMHASIFDDCTEIYAETDFPFMKSERLQPTMERTVSVEKKSREERRKEKKKEEKEKKANQKQDENNGVAIASLQMEKLSPYQVLNGIVDLFKEKTTPDDNLLTSHDLNLSRTKAEVNKVYEIYNTQQRAMIFLEELAHSKFLEQFNRAKIQLTHLKDRLFCFPITDELSGLVTEIGNNSVDFVILKPTNKPEQSNQMITFNGRIYGIQKQQIVIQFLLKTSDQLKNSYKNEVFEIFFELNRVAYQQQPYAWDFIDRQNLFSRLICNSFYRSTMPQIEVQDHALMTNGSMLSCLNKDQRKAIECILRRKGNVPYIIIGPPGTGKTYTLIGLIQQIVRTTVQNVLVCALSNESCDAITESLTNVLQKNEVYRFYGDSCKYVQPSSRVEKVANVNSNEVFYSTLEFLYRFRVIVCTLSSAGFLTRARERQTDWAANHFEYVVIDDCASAPQLMSLIPIADTDKSDQSTSASQSWWRSHVTTPGSERFSNLEAGHFI